MNSYTIKLPPIPQKQHFSVYEAARLSGISPLLLSEWENIFVQLPRKRPDQARYYTKDDILLVRKISWLIHQNNYTAAQVQQHLGDDGVSHSASCSHYERDNKEILKALLAELKQLESDLA